MRAFILILLFSINAFAAGEGDWRDIEDPKNSAAYATQRVCETRTTHICGRCTDNRRCMKGLVDDLNQPNYRAAENSPVKLDCDDASDCQSKATDPNGDSNTNDRVCLSDNSTERWDDLSNWSGITGVSGPWFIWCEKFDGTFKQIDGLVLDVAGSAAADAEDAQNASDNLARDAAKMQRDIDLDQCVADSKAATLTLPQATSCIRAMIREMRGTRVPVDDL